MVIGCLVRYEFINFYVDVCFFSVICKEFCVIMDDYGYEVFYNDLIDFFVGFIDMGNVIYECLGFYGLFGIDIEVG